MTYKEAIRLPKGGAVAMNDLHMLAHVALSTAERLCMRPHAIYEWAVAQHITWGRLGPMGRTRETGMDLMLAVLNGKPYREDASVS